MEPQEGESHVVVLDGIRGITAGKFDLVQRLSRVGRYRLVAVTDHHINAGEMLQLRTSLYPVITLTLGNLPRRDAREYFVRVATALGLPWGEGELTGLASATGGYPPAMVEAAARAARRLAEDRGSGPGACAEHALPVPPPCPRATGGPG